MALATQCPHCYTSFRVANDQLKLYAGMVRCGTCKQTFNGIEHLIPPGSSPKPAPVSEPSPPTTNLDQSEEEIEAIEQEQPQENLSADEKISEDEQKSEADSNDETELESNLRALLEEIKIRQQEEENTVDDAHQLVAATAIDESETEEPLEEDHTEEDALAHLEIIPIEEEPQIQTRNKTNAKPLSANIDFDLDDDKSPIRAAIKQNNQQLDVEEIEEIRTLETAIESELNYYDGGDKKEPTATASTLFTTTLQPENLSPDIEESHQDIDKPAQTDEHDKEETPNFVIRAQKKQRYGKWTSIGLSLGVFIALCGTIAQSSYVFRDVIAAEYPQTKPHLLALCRLAKCEIKLPAQKSQLEISGSELQILTNDPLVNELNFQIQNKGKSAQTWPHLELILKDVRGKTVLQKVIAPNVYLENKAQLTTGIPGNSESAHKLNFGLGIPKASSYAVDLFYP